MIPILSLAAALFAAPASAQADRDLVLVNGTPIRHSEVVERLWARHGAETLEELIDELLMRQAAQQRKITATPGEVDKRLGRLKENFPDEQLFLQQVERAGTTVDKLRGDIGEQIKREKLVVRERKLAVNEEELKKAFDAHKEELGVKEGVRLRHILVKTQAEADEIVAKLKGGADFQALARERSLAPTGKISGGDYGIVSRGMLPPEIEEIAFAMKRNEIKIVPTERGFHILQALERRAAKPARYAEVKDELRDAMLQEKMKAALPELLAELRQKADVKFVGRP